MALAFLCLAERGGPLGAVLPSWFLLLLGIRLACVRVCEGVSECVCRSVLLPSLFLLYRLAFCPCSIVAAPATVCELTKPRALRCLPACRPPSCLPSVLSPLPPAAAGCY